jgi:hypothetical protein
VRTETYPLVALHVLLDVHTAAGLLALAIVAGGAPTDRFRMGLRTCLVVFFLDFGDESERKSSESLALVLLELFFSDLSCAATHFSWSVVAVACLISPGLRGSAGGVAVKLDNGLELVESYALWTDVVFPEELLDQLDGFRCRHVRHDNWGFCDENNNVLQR